MRNLRNLNIPMCAYLGLCHVLSLYAVVFVIALKMDPVSDLSSFVSSALFGEGAEDLAGGLNTSYSPIKTSTLLFAA